MHRSCFFCSPAPLVPMPSCLLSILMLAVRLHRSPRIATLCCGIHTRSATHVASRYVVEAMHALAP